MMLKAMSHNTRERRVRMTRVGLLTVALLAVPFIVSDFTALGSRAAAVPQTRVEDEPGGNPLASGVIDGATHPELIPDYRAYHLVLLAASALREDPEEDKARAQAFVSTIVRHRGVDAPALGDVANQYRRAFLLLDGTTRPPDAGDPTAYEKAKRDLVVATLQQIRSRLSSVGLAALRTHIQNEKRNIKLYPLPDMATSPKQAASFPFLIPTVYAQGPSCGELGGDHCDQSGSCPPGYDNLGQTWDCNPCCKSQPPPDPGPSCGEIGGDYCSQSGSCPASHNSLGNTYDCQPCCQSQPGMSPSGATYSGRAINGSNSTLYATAITDGSSSCGCHQSWVSARITAPWGSAYNSASGGERVQTTAAYPMSEAEFPDWADIAVVTEHHSYCPFISREFINSVQGPNLVRVRAFTARLVWSRHGSSPEPHGPNSIDFYGNDACSGNCQPAYVTYNHSQGFGHAWLEIKGFDAVDGNVRNCYGRSFGRSSRPECKPT